ncbi:GTP 3',8-cyclase MoaA [Rivihabitans pingtungensis]|uniref:GTP 3',8-cyclase MoaA n=1 Tax=Rivihabitans pingtungensis TaxID=1054498 RepID=UPI002FDB8808
MLQDRFGRAVEYVRLSVTDRCDLRCSYCIPKGFKDFAEPEDWLTFAEIERVIGAFVRLGARRVRLTGGEPLLRRGVVDLAARLAALPGLRDLSVSTNGAQLARLAGPLKAAGVGRVNVSLDSLRRECIAEVTGRDCLPQVLDGLKAAKAAGLTPIKLNMVLLPGVNDQDVESMAAFCIEHGFILRLIEAMPMGDSGRSVGYLDAQGVLARLRARFDLRPQTVSLGGGPARYWATADGRFTLGVISPISQHFCATCNRVRLSVDGVLYMCLGQEESVELRPLLRAGISDADLQQVLRQAIELKPERHVFASAPGKVVRIMAKTGG